MNVTGLDRAVTVATVFAMVFGLIGRLVLQVKTLFLRGPTAL